MRWALFARECPTWTASFFDELVRVRACLPGQELGLRAAVVAYGWGELDVSLLIGRLELGLAIAWGVE